MVFGFAVMRTVDGIARAGIGRYWVTEEDLKEFSAEVLVSVAAVGVSGVKTAKAWAALAVPLTELFATLARTLVTTVPP